MRVVEGYEHVPAEVTGGIVAIGNLDGVHRGHQALIARTVAGARAVGGPAGALVFEPHPRAFFQPDKPLFRLTELPRKLELLAALGLDMTAVLAFDADLARQTADEFIERVLVRGLAVRGVVVGYDFQFGRNRGGTPSLLSEAGARHGFSVDVVAPVTDDSEAYSSSRIRAALAQGDVAAAANLLGYRWRIAGEVVGGAKRGTGLGFPTANVRMPAGTELGHGIYAVWVHVDGARHAGAAYFGSRPTFDNGQPVLEVFLLDFDGNLYGRRIETEFVDFVRGDRKFESGEALAAQMDRDCAAARRALDAASERDPLAGLPLAGR
jgi:riboflavin kinase/FMN adenylyltransferase